MTAEPSVLDNTVDMLQILDDNELEAIQSVAEAFISNSSVSRPYRPLSEDELLARIDHSIDQIEQGAYQDSESFENELVREFGL